MSNPMNFSDETVSKVKKKIALEMYGVEEFADIDENEREQCLGMAIIYAKAALSSLTLADLMQVEEIRELVNGGRRAARILDDTGYDPDTFDALAEALTPFTEAK